MLPNAVREAFPGGFSLECSTMMRLAIVFLGSALIAAFFGFAGVGDYSWKGAQNLSLVLLVLALLCFMGGIFRIVFKNSSA
jgi:uncharacterized membrane protein YtjA (UPF0391 family)